MERSLAIFFAFADAWKMYLSASSKLQNKNLRVANNTAIAQTPTAPDGRMIDDDLS